MKYLILLGLLVGCNSSPQFKAGDCVRSLGNGTINFFSIKEVTKTKYVVTSLLNIGRIVETDEIAFNFSFIDEYYESTKIDCSEVK